MMALGTFQLRTALRGRAVLVWVVAFSAAAGIVAVLGLDSFRQIGLGSVGPAAVALVNLALLLPTAQAILLGALAVSGERESGMAAVMRARGVSSLRLVLTAWLAMFAAACASLVAGFGVAALVLAGNVPMEDMVTFGALLGVTAIASGVAGALGVLIGAAVATRLHAALVAVAVWFALSIGLDLVAIGMGAFLRLGEAALQAAILLNPIEACRVAALLLLDASGGVLGPLGIYLVERLGREGSLALLLLAATAWILVPLLLAAWAMRRRDV